MRGVYGGELNGDHVATDADRQTLLDLGVGAEIDLRIDYDNGGAGESVFGFSATDGTYYYANANDFHTEDMTSSESHARWKAEFDLLLSNLREGKSVYFHCIWGADRTGLFSLLLEGLLGVTEDQSNKNYELTSFSLAGARWRGSQDGFFAHINTLEGETLQQRFATFFRESLGVSQEDIDDFRHIMLIPMESTVVRSGMSAGQYGTVCLPFDATVSNASLYRVAGVDSKTSPTVLYIEEVGTSLSAGVSYIFQSATAEDVVFTLDTGNTWTPVATTEALCGTYEVTTAVAGTYVLSNNKWMAVREGKEPTVGAYRAWLDLTRVDELNAPLAKYRSMALWGDDVTGIEGRRMEDDGRKDALHPTGDRMFDLTGRRVKNPAAGIYILGNGKKVLNYKF